MVEFMEPFLEGDRNATCIYRAIAEEGVISSDATSVGNSRTIHFRSNTAGIYTSSMVHPECLKWPLALCSLLPTCSTHHSKNTLNSWAGSSS
jgi:hypothetical protein